MQKLHVNRCGRILPSSPATIVSPVSVTTVASEVEDSVVESEDLVLLLDVEELNQVNLDLTLENESALIVERVIAFLLDDEAVHVRVLAAKRGNYLVDKGSFTLFVVFEDVTENFDCSEA